MKLQIFHARKISTLQEHVNAFLQDEQVSSIHHTQYSAIPREDALEYWTEYTLLVFYYPRVEEPDPFQEDDEELKREVPTIAESAHPEQYEDDWPGIVETIQQM